jgi:hypothetical protein
MCLSKKDGYRNTFSQTSHSCCALFLFTPFLIKVVSSFRISFCSISKTTSSSSGIFKHNTGSSSSTSSSAALASKLDTFKTVLAFTARCGCGFFRLMLLLVLLEVVHVVHVVLDLSFHQNEEIFVKTAVFFLEKTIVSSKTLREKEEREEGAVLMSR